MRRGRRLCSNTRSPRCGGHCGRSLTRSSRMALLWYLMYLCLPVSWWLVVPLAVLAGGLLVRVFIIFHDCGHGSFFKSRGGQRRGGISRGHPDVHAVLSLALGTRHPSRSAGDLDRRGTGDVWTHDGAGISGIVALEKIRLPAGAQSVRAVRASRRCFCFVIRQRFPSPKASPRERHSVYAMNAAILGMAVGLSWFSASRRIC